MFISNNRDNMELRKYVVALYNIKRQYTELSRKYEAEEKRLTTAVKNYIYCNKGMSGGFEFQRNNKITGKTESYRVKRIEPKSVRWDADGLEKVLDKDVRKQVINKQYVVNDLDGLVSYLKKCGVDPVIFKSFLDISKSVNVEALEQLDALGKIDREAVEKCCSVDIKTSYLKINMLESE